MAIKRPKTWFVCDKCNEWFHYPKNDPPKKCLDCKKGTLKQTCADCGEDFNNCKCKYKE